MIKLTPVTDALPILTLSAVPVFDDHVRQWVRDLELKGQKLHYLLHPDFQPGYQFGYQVYQDALVDGYVPTLKSVIQEIEFSLSHALHNRDESFLTSRGSSCTISYPWKVGSLFGYLTALLQADTTLEFSFLLAPVSAMHSCLARVSGRSCVL